MSMREPDADVIIVGGGLAGCSAAIVLARAGLTVFLMERGDECGNKNMTGGRLYGHSLEKIIPDFAKEAPIERIVKHEKISLMTEDGSLDIGYQSGKLSSSPENASYTVLRAKFDAWLAEKAMEAGVEVIPGIKVDHIVVEDGKVIGIESDGEEMIANCDWELMGILDTKIQELLRQYYYVGGMPEAVLDYTTHGDVNKIRKIQKAILKTYDNDFAKHAGNETERIRLVWKSIPAQLAKENKKFIYGAVKTGGRARDLESAIQWLIDAKLAFKVHRCNKPTMPLSFYEDFNAFKLFTLDVGLLGAMANAPASLMLTSNDVFKEFKGAFSENYVFEQLRTFDDLSIYYFSKENSTQEIDFLVQTDERIIPIEVKAEENLRSKSLRGFIVEDYPDEHFKGLRCSMKPYVDQDWMENIPLYGVLGYINKQIESEK